MDCPVCCKSVLISGLFPFNIWEISTRTFFAPVHILLFPAGLTLLKLSSLLLTSGLSDPNHYLNASNIKFRFIKPGARSNCSQQNIYLYFYRCKPLNSMFENQHTKILISSVILFFPFKTCFSYGTFSQI